MNPTETETCTFDADGLCHSTGMPSKTVNRCHANGLVEIAREEYHFHGKLHRENGPAIVRYANGTVYSTEWYYSGKRHRRGGPAKTIGINNYELVEYWVDGGRHREDGPAVIQYPGPLEYWREGKRHREDGPAVDHYGRNGSNRVYWTVAGTACSVNCENNGCPGCVYEDWKDGELQRKWSPNIREQFRAAVKGFDRDSDSEESL